MPPPLISVAICTYNRAASLHKTLASLAALAPSPPFEVMVVDNNSADATRGIVESHAAATRPRYVFEPRQGLSHARNRALAEMTGQLIVFADDDVLLEPGWLASYAAAATAFPDAEYFGGRIRPYWTDGRPGWVRDEGMALIGGLLGTYDLGMETRMYAGGDMHPFGANFALRRRLVDRLGGFRTDMGVVGRNAGRGEEADYFLRARQAGACGVYVGGALCHHAVSRRSLTLRHLYRFGIQKGIAAVQMQDRAAPAGGEALLALKALYQLAKGNGDRCRQTIINMGIRRGVRSMRGRPAGGASQC